MFFIFRRIFTMIGHGCGKFLPHLADFCVLVSTGAVVGWGGDTGGPCVSGTEHRRPEPFKLPCCCSAASLPLGRFPPLPKIRGDTVKPQRDILGDSGPLAVVSGTGPRAEMPPRVFAVGWAGRGALGAATGVSLPQGTFCSDADVGDAGGGGGVPDREVSAVWGGGTAGFGAPHPQGWAAARAALTTAGFPGKNNSTA